MNLSKPQYRLHESEYRRFADLVRQKSGLECTVPRWPDLERVVRQTLTELALPDASALYKLLADGQTGQPALESFIAKLTVGETYFFRNQPQMEALERHILPQLIARRQATRQLRLWSAGCATGEEPYSLAMLLHRLLPNPKQWNILLLATDINRQALDKAKQGLYGSWSFRHVSPEIRSTYFIQHGQQWELLPAIRNMVTFNYLNLVEDIYPSLRTNTQLMDVILCRNVLIYFRPDTAHLVIDRLYNGLAQEGWLLVGHAEPSQSLSDRLAVRSFPGTITYQKNPSLRPALLSSCDKARLSPAPRAKVKASTFSNKANNPAMRPVTTPLPSGSLEMRAILTLVAAGQIDVALQQLKFLTLTQPDDAMAPYLVAKLQADRLELDAACEWLELALQRDPFLVRGHYLQGLILQEMGRLEATLDALRRCLYIDSEFVLGHFTMAGLLARLGQTLRAQKALDNVRRLLAGRNPAEVVPEGDGLTVGRLLQLVEIQQELWTCP